MDFDRLLDGAQLSGNLFVQFASNDVLEHFAFAGRERGQTRADFEKFRLLSTKGVVFLNRYTNGCKQVLIVHRFGEEITRAAFHRLHALRNVTVSGQKNNGQATASVGENALQFQAADGRHSEIEHETA